MKILICITGASLIKCSKKLIDEISKKAQTYVIFSTNAKLVYEKENHSFISYNNDKVTYLDNCDLSSCVASGSFGIDKTIIAPCSINTLAKINAGICDNLILRAAGVALKEKKELILGVREMPFSAISCKHMANLSSMGVIIAPPILAEYNKAQSVDEIYDFIVGKWLDLLKIEHNLYNRWGV